MNYFVKFLAFKVLLFSAHAFTDEEFAQGFAIHGNWCGPGHGGGQPIDTLDGLCMDHDLCYEETILFSCKCDKELVSAIEQNAGKMSIQEQLIGSIISQYFSVAPCIDI